MSVHALATDWPRHTLLVVDDQPLNIQVLYQALSANFRVLKALNGAEALQVCRQHRPDLILLDVVMPGMDGFEVCRQLKAEPQTREIPVIFVTAHDDASHEALGLELGAVDFIGKPINAAVVRARVNTHLGFARSNSLLAATLEASSDGILVTDLAGGLRSMNRAFIQMWNLPDHMIAKALPEAVFAFMRLQLIESERGGDDPMHALPRIDPGTSFDVLELVGDRHIERYVTPLHINGNLSGQVFTFREDTDRRRAADALLRLNESLESRILERTQELESATHLAQAASQAKSDFLSNMSHEIRTPMNAVIGLAFLALKTDLNAVQRNYLEKIYHSGRHLLGIINDILDFSKIEAGMLALDESDFKVSVVFDSVSRMTAEAAKAKGLDLAFEIDASLSRSLHGDSLRLGQVLLNYVGNAIKFTTQGGVRVRAMTQQRFKTESLIRFEIEDTGIGLTEAQIGQLFQSFQQADTSTTRNYGGTGLGLALCKQLAELMGGEVGVRSQPGQGSVFWFTCRLRFGAPETSKLQVPTVLPAVGDAREAIHGARILVVDDNLLNQEVTAGLLEDVGAKVTLANHGQAALDQLGAERFDCVLMDVQMPVMDGLQATRLIRENPLFANMPVLAMTANARSEDRARCAESGMNDFLTKPVMPDRLYATLAYWLTHSPAIAAAGSGSDSAPPEQAAAVPGGDPDIIDLSILSQQVGGDPQKIRRYAMLFVEAIPKSMAELETALEQGDVSALADLGHRMKSSSRMVGALGLASLCETLEALRQSGSLDEICHIVGEIRLVLARISADIAVALQE